MVGGREEYCFCIALVGCRSGEEVWWLWPCMGDWLLLCWDLRVVCDAQFGWDLVDIFRG